MFIAQVAGHLAKDPETRFTPDGQKVTNFTIAVNQRKGKEEVTYWVNVTIWGDRFDKMVPHLKKGSAVIVIGQLSLREYTNKEGRNVTSIELNAEIVRFSPFGKSDRPDQNKSAAGVVQPYGASQHAGYGQEENEQGAFHSHYNKPAAAAPGAPSYGAAAHSGHGHASTDSLDDDLPF